jgi:hypothetical protein
MGSMMDRVFMLLTSCARERDRIVRCELSLFTSTPSSPLPGLTVSQFTRHPCGHESDRSRSLGQVVCLDTHSPSLPASQISICITLVFKTKIVKNRMTIDYIVLINIDHQRVVKLLHVNRKAPATDRHVRTPRPVAGRNCTGESGLSSVSSTGVAGYSGDRMMSNSTRSTGSTLLLTA